MDGTGLLFYRQASRLARRHRVVTYRLRDEGSRIETHVDDLVRVIRATSPDGDPVTVVGESFGGAIALSAAIERSDRIGDLVVVNSFPYFRPQLRLRLAMLGIRLLPWSAMPLVRRFTASRLHSDHTGRDEIRRFLELTRETTRRGYLNRLRALTRYDVRGRLGEIRSPTLFLAADEDHLVPAVEQAEYMARRVPRATLRVLRGHGHICLIAPDLDLDRLLQEWRSGGS